MARGGRPICKKSKRRGRDHDDDDDDEDEEYVVGEDEGSESFNESDVNSRDFSDDVSFKFTGSDDDDEEDELQNRRSNRNMKKSKSKSGVKRVGRGRGKKSRVSDDDDDEEFVPDEEDELDEKEVSRSKGRKKSRKGRRDVAKGRRKRSDSLDLNDDFVDDDDDDDDDFVEKDIVAIKNRRKNSKKGKKTKGSNGGRKRRKKKRLGEVSESSDSDFFLSDEDEDVDEDDFELEDQISVQKKQKRSKMGESVGLCRRRRNTSSMIVESEDDDRLISENDEFDLDYQLVGNKRQKKGKDEEVVESNKRRRNMSLMVLESEDDERLIGKDDDEVFVPKDRIVDGLPKDRIVDGPRQKRSIKNPESDDSDFAISNEETDDQDLDDEDDDFDVKDHYVVDKQQRKSKKGKGRQSNKRRKRKRSSVVLESSESDYMISEDDNEFVSQDLVVVDERPRKRKKTREQINGPKNTRRKPCSLMDSDSESFNFDDMTSEEDVGDLTIGKVLKQEQPKRALTKGEEKGKEKYEVDSGKQVCGICLSEEKKSAIQGLLNCCTHYFCFACIMEWSKVESRCPVCKRRFETITKSGRSDPGFGMRSAVIRVEKRDQVYQPSEEELQGMIDPYENVVCMECHRGGDDNLMLLCDVCDSSAHTYCVGLGMEVPEGNWYCECCRPVNEGPSNSQFQDRMPDQVAHNNNLFPGISGRGAFTNVRATTNFPQPVSMYGRSSSLRIDLNASPREFPGEDQFVSSPISGSGASTVSGRRHIRRRIHVILSNNRQRYTSPGTNVLSTNSTAGTVTGDALQDGLGFPLSEDLSPLPSILSFEQQQQQQQQQNPRPFFRSHSSLAPCIFNEGSSSRLVDRANEEVQKW